MAELTVARHDSTHVSVTSKSHRLRIQLYEKLTLVDRRLPERLEGAINRALEGGADAASQGAHSLMEAVDWTLRRLSPDSDVVAWHARTGQDPTELVNGRPTRTLRVRHAAAVRGIPADAAVKLVNLLRDELQRAKHASGRPAVDALRGQVQVVEAFLTYLLLGGTDS